MPTLFKLFAEKLFEHENILTNGTIDIEAAKSSLKRHVKHQEWLNLYEKALPICKKFSEENCAVIQSKIKRFTKEQCNVKYIWLMWCMDLYGFAVSFSFDQKFHEAISFTLLIIINSIAQNHRSTTRQHVITTEILSKNASLIPMH